MSNKLDKVKSKAGELLSHKDEIKQHSKLLLKYKDDVDYVFPVLLNNYIIACEYLYHDFNIKKLKIGGSITKLKDECELEETLEKEIRSNKDIRKLRSAPIMAFIGKTRFLNLFKYNKWTKTWLCVSTILKCYPDVIDHLQSKTKGLGYKELDYTQEREMIEKYNYLIHDFKFLEK